MANQDSPFQKRLQSMIMESMLANGIALGGKLKLFDALAAVGTPEKPASPKEVAEKAGCKERYVKEWLGAMACGDIIEVTEDEKFFIKPENVQYLNSTSMLVTQPAMNIAIVEPFSKLVEVVKKDGPLGLEYDNYSKFYEEMATVSESWHRAHMFSDYLPLLGVKDQLECGGLKVLDVGCGGGFHAALLAEKYPKCQFVGIDISEKAIKQAKDKKKEADGSAFTNLEFFVMDAGKMNPDWNDHFDLALIFDACHDQMRPDLCLKEIHRVLKSSGRFGMLEVDGTSNIYHDKQRKSMGAVFPYMGSLLHCLPVGSNSPDALCLGAAWGKERAQKLLKEAGFSRVEVKDTPFFPLNILYVSYK